MARIATLTTKDGTDLSPKIRGKLKAGLLKGLTIEQACFYADISKTRLYEVIAENKKVKEEGERLEDEIELWQKQLNITAKINIAERIEKGKDIELSKWHLERREKENYSPRQEVTGKDGDKLFELNKEKQKELDNVLNDNK